MTQSSPTELVEQLDAEQLRVELDELERRREALRILYRAALARGRRRSQQQQPKDGGEATRAS